MGRRSLGNKSSSDPDQAVPPPPPNGTRQSPLTVETTTRNKSSTTKTETTPHLLSFPAWRKSNNTKSTNSQHPRPAGRVQKSENRTPSIQFDKALPPTPTDSSPHSMDTPKHKPQLKPPNKDRVAPQSHSVVEFPQASVGPGPSQQVLPHTAALSTSRENEVNTVAFISSSPSLQREEHIPTVRRFKSSQRMNTAPIPTPDQTGRRTRGISLGPTSLSHPTSDEKRGEKVVEQHKTLLRRPSFWSRRKNRNLDVSRPRPATAYGDISLDHRSSEVNLSNLPSLPIPNEKSQARIPFTHTFSERPQSYHPVVGSDISASPIAERHPSTRRPSTAGSPVTAEHTASTNRLSPGSGRATTVSFSETPTNPSAPIPRLRSQTNPPLLHRLSLNVFSSSTFLATSPTSSPTSPFPSPVSGPSRKPLIVPQPMDNEESPDAYVGRLVDAVGRGEVTSILASRTEPFYVAALKAFIGRFNFVDKPLDIALRKLLLEIGLPKETQQIDRVMEAFAQRYIHNNPDLYISEDHPYILAFSLIMLHTDAFNKSNRRKMTKADYVKNTRLTGVAPEILEYFYDNIVFAPFIFIEDPLDLNGDRGLITESNRRSTAFRDLSSTNPSVPLTGTSGSTLGIKTNKIDLYYMISADLLSPLRIDVGSYIPLADPFSYQGTAGRWDEEELLLAFTNAQVMELRTDTARSSTFFGLANGSSSSPLISMNPTIPAVVYEEPSTLRVTKLGLVNRKDDFSEGGKKPLSRKWKSWGALLTGSQLLFCRDPTWMQVLAKQTEKDNSQTLVLPSAILKVDESLSMKNAVAVHDKTYTKHRFTFRLALSDGRQILLKALSESDMNQWIARINYASAFRTAGIRMRPRGMSGRSMQLTGVAAATSHLHDLQNQIHAPSKGSARWDENAPQELLEMLLGDEPKRPHFERKVALKSNKKDVEIETSVLLEVEKTAEFKDAFDQVKANLAAENWTQIGQDSQSGTSLSIPSLKAPRGYSNPSAGSSHLLAEASHSNDHPRLLSRSQIIEAKIADLSNRLVATETNLGTHMRFVRNIATLTPFQRATRDRLIAAVQAKARTVMQLRLDIARMRCHRNVLRDDLDAENRIWKEVKDTALKAAKETLQSRQSSPEIPQVTLSARGSRYDSLSKPLQRQKRRKSESSICESFHTAIDFGPDWPSSDDLGSSLLAASRVFDSPRPSTSGSFSSYPIEGNSSRIWKSEPESAAGSQAGHDIMPTGETPDHDTQHEKFFTAQESPIEEAEAWNNTRCAKRVSLVRVPSTLDLLPVSKRLTLTLSTTAEPQES